ncbi:MAG TPA: EamA family transporter [Solirubrobacteraceae bacterium]|nr:EamA family transporter [Solirubrobacteraceae bacterium]
MTRRAWWAFGFMSVVWGASYLLIKVAIDGGMPAPAVAWVRVALAAVVLVAPAWRSGALRGLRGRWRWIWAYAVAEISIPFPLIAAGEVHVASSLAAIIIAAVPLLVTVLSLRFDPSERPTRRRALGLVIGFAGVVALVGIDIAGSGAELLGAGAILIGAVGYAIGPMVVKLGMSGLDTRAVMGASLLVATLLLAPFAAADLPARAPTVGAWAAVVALGLLCTAIAFVVYTVLIREAGPGRATVITYINPLVALALGTTLLGERPGAGAVAGLVLILIGSWLSTGGARLPALGRRQAARTPQPAPGSSAPEQKPSGGPEVLNSVSANGPIAGMKKR